MRRSLFLVYYLCINNFQVLLQKKMSKKQQVHDYNDQHSVLYEHHRQQSLEKGDTLAFETIVDEENKLEESEYKENLQRTKS